MIPEDKFNTFIAVLLTEKFKYWGRKGFNPKDIDRELLTSMLRIYRNEVITRDRFFEILECYMEAKK